jgi:integrase
VKLLQKDGGEWHLSYEDGHRNKWTISLKTIEKSVAEKIAEVIGAEVAKFHNGAVPSVQKVFSDWLTEKEIEVAIATLEFYRQTVNEFIGYLGARSTNEVSEVSRHDIIDYRSRLVQRRLRPKTINHRVKTLRSIFQFAVREGFITENPAIFVKSIKNNGPRARRPFTLPEVQAIISVANPEWKSLIKFGLYSGQRLGDLARLTWQSIDLTYRLANGGRLALKHLMGFRFRKRIRLAKGIFWNLGKKGSSLSIGRRGATMNISKKGARDTFSLPGSGVSYQTKRVQGSGCLVLLVAIPTFGIPVLFMLTRAHFPAHFPH